MEFWAIEEFHVPDSDTQMDVLESIGDHLLSEIPENLKIIDFQ